METSTDSKIEDVRPDSVVLQGVGNGKDGRQTHSLFQDLEGASCRVSPKKGFAGAKEVGKGSGYMTEVVNELPIEVAEIEETTDIQKGLRLRPCLDGLKFLRIYRDLSSGNDMA